MRAQSGGPASGAIALQSTPVWSMLMSRVIRPTLLVRQESPPPESRRGDSALSALTRAPLGLSPALQVVQNLRRARNYPRLSGPHFARYGALRGRQLVVAPLPGSGQVEATLRIRASQASAYIDDSLRSVFLARAMNFTRLPSFGVVTPVVASHAR